MGIEVGLYTHQLKSLLHLHWAEEKTEVYRLKSTPLIVRPPLGELEFEVMFYTYTQFQKSPPPPQNVGFTIIFARANEHSNRDVPLYFKSGSGMCCFIIMRNSLLDFAINQIRTVKKTR